MYLFVYVYIYRVCVSLSVCFVWCLPSRCPCNNAIYQYNQCFYSNVLTITVLSLSSYSPLSLINVHNNISICGYLSLRCPSQINAVVVDLRYWGRWHSIQYTHFHSFTLFFFLFYHHHNNLLFSGWRLSHTSSLTTLPSSSSSSSSTHTSKNFQLHSFQSSIDLHQWYNNNYLIFSFFSNSILPLASKP